MTHATIAVSRFWLLTRIVPELNIDVPSPRSVSSVSVLHTPAHQYRRTELVARLGWRDKDQREFYTVLTQTGHSSIRVTNPQIVIPSRYD